MPLSTDELPPDLDDRPPVLKHWRQLYIIVLLLHALIIALFYWFTHTFAMVQN